MTSSATNFVHMASMYTGRKREHGRLKPVIMSYEEAAAVPFGACTALYNIRYIANIPNRQKIGNVVITVEHSSK
jgi:hypothetical protein